MDTLPINCKTCNKQYYYKRSTGCTKLICGTCKSKRNKKPKLIPSEFGNCRTCKLNKSKENFSLDKSRSSGLNSQCKSCRRIRSQNNTASVYYKSKEYKDYFAKNKHVFYKKRRESLNYRLISSARCRMYSALKNNTKNATTLKMLGVNSVEELWIHLESKFSEGMTRENYGEWHVDHIKPCSSFDFTIVEEQHKCFHYTNLQPLWAIDNIKKGNKYNGV